MRLFRLTFLGLLVAGLTLALTPHSASAHPMGNFTINHYSALTVGAGQVRVLYVIDMAEIPTYQELGTIRADHSPDLTAAERAAYMARQAPELLKGLALTLDGTALPLAVAAPPEMTLPIGAGNLPTLRFVMTMTASLGSAQAGALAYADNNYPDRIGWKEIIAQAAEGTALQNASVPATDESAALTQYRTDFLNNPPLVTTASLRFAPGSAAAPGTQPAAAPAPAQDALAWAQSRGDALTALINQDELPLGALLVGLLIAFGFGAAHALSPGHGKTVVAAYLVGSRGTAWHAAFLGLIVTVSHTIGVFVFGLVVLYASQYIVPEKIYPWLGGLSGGLIVVVGIVMFMQRRRAWLRAGRKLALAVSLSTGPDHPHEHGHDHPHDHDHTHDHEHTHADDHDYMHTHSIAHEHDHDHAHDHDHDHGHDHAHADDPAVPHRHGPFGRAHTHLPADGQQVTVGNMLALGITGGIIPCPSALVVLLAAIAYHKLSLGLLLILAFSLGLALVLTAIGIVMVYGRSLLGRARLPLNNALVARLPMVSALAVSCLGLLIAIQAVSGGLVLR
jgi:nickel/cobalt exporter